MIIASDGMFYQRYCRYYARDMTILSTFRGRWAESVSEPRLCTRKYACFWSNPNISTVPKCLMWGSRWSGYLLLTSSGNHWPPYLRRSLKSDGKAPWLKSGWLDQTFERGNQPPRMLILHLAAPSTFRPSDLHLLGTLGTYESGTQRREWTLLWMDRYLHSQGNGILVASAVNLHFTAIIVYLVASLIRWHIACEKMSLLVVKLGVFTWY